MEHACRVEVNLDELSEAGRIVILESLRVAKGLKQRVRVQYLLLNSRICRLVLHGFGLGRLFVKEVLLWATESFTSTSKVG